MTLRLCSCILDGISESRTQNDECFILMDYRNDPKFSDRYAWVHSADPEEQSDQGLHCLPFHLHRLDSLLMVEPHSSNFRVITTNFLGVRIFRKLTVINFIRCIFTSKELPINQKNEQYPFQ